MRDDVPGNSDRELSNVGGQGRYKKLNASPKIDTIQKPIVPNHVVPQRVGIEAIDTEEVHLSSQGSEVVPNPHAADLEGRKEGDGPIMAAAHP